jgi:hypothetical protein
MRVPDPFRDLDNLPAPVAHSVAHSVAQAVATSPALALGLVEIIELKWLMVAEGVRVHVERLQTDAAYADHMLRLAAASQHATLRATALRLRKRLGLPADLR